MLNRRTFLKATALAVPLAGCTSKDTTPHEEAVRKNAEQFESTLEAVRKADVPYSVEPTFYPSQR